MGWSTRQSSLPPIIPVHPRYVLSALSSKATIGVPWFAATTSLLLFSSMMIGDLAWRSYGADSGELITASMTLGVAHPPGYPLYILIGRLFGLLPIGSIIARYAFLSALSGAAAIGLAVHCMIRRREALGLAWTAVPPIGLALALTPLLWSQASIVEVYALSLFFVALFLWAVLSERSSLVIGLTFGLAVSSHLTGILLLPMAIWRITRAGVPRFVLGAAVGLAPFTLLPWLAAGRSPLVWGDLDSLSGWWWLVSAQLYRPNVFGLPPAIWPTRLFAWLNPTVLIPAVIWLALAALVAWHALRSRDKLSIALLTTALLYLSYAFTYATDDAAVLMLPVLLISAVVAGSGLKDRHKLKIWLLPSIMLLLTLSSIPDTNESTLRHKTVSALAQVPLNAIVLTPGDATISALWYFHHVEGLRPDIIIVDDNMFQFEWYRDQLRNNSPTLQVPLADDLEQFVAENSVSRPICEFSLNIADSPNCVLPNLESSLDS